MEGELVTIESSVYKGMLQDSLRAKTPAEVLENDNGHIPGDKKGAGGLDSSMWSHIKRNWLWSSKLPRSKSSTSQNEKSGNIRGPYIASLKPVPIKYKELMSNSRKIYMTNVIKTTATGLNIIKRPKSKIIHRKIKAKRKSAIKHKEEMDTKDKMILKKIGKVFRAKFNKKEDNILYICRAANCFLSKNGNIFKASKFLIRDLLHILSPESLYKTSGACSRRMAKLDRCDLFMKKIKERSCELINIKDLSTYFAPIIFNLNQSARESSSSYSSYSTMDKNVAFVHAVWYIYNNYELAENILIGESKNVDYFRSDNIQTFGPLLVDVETKKSVFSNPKNHMDIEKETVKSVLMSALNCSRLGQNISYQFYQICKKYSDQHIRYAVSSSKSYQAISVNKKPQISISSSTAVKSIPFQLSVTYNHMQKSAFNCLILKTIYQHFREVIMEEPSFADEESTKNFIVYSRLLARNELATIWPEYRITVDVPESSHGLSPTIDKTSPMVKDLAKLYQNYVKDDLANLNNPSKRAKKMNTKMSTTFIDPNTTTKQFGNLRANIKRLLSNLPCYYNETINKTVPLFLECNEEDRLREYLKIFLAELFKIVLNLFSTIPEPLKLLQSYISRFYRVKKIESLCKELEFKIVKLAYLVKQFLSNHELTDIIHCFENKLLETSNVTLMDIIQKWLDKSKMVYPQVTFDETIDNSPKQKNTSCFFKYMMIKDNNETSVTNDVDDVPEIEEIVDGMLETSENRRGNIPHISEVVSLLSQDNRSNPKEEKLLEDIKDNFVFEYPTLDKFEMDKLAQFKKSHSYLLSDKGLPNLEEIVNRYCHVRESNNMQWIQEIKNRGGTNVDNLLTGEIIGYVYNQRFLGATGAQILKTFGGRQRSLDLHVIVEILCNSFILLEVGVKEITFVHTEHSDPWLVETFHLSPHENHLLHASVNDELQMLQDKIESRIQSSKPVKVIMMPWLHLDGTLNTPLLHKWLTIVLSFCLENQNCSLEHLSEKFYLVKPVELFFLLKVLKALGCLKILAYEECVEDLWSDVQELQIHPANILDSFSNMFVEVHTFATIHLGQYFSRDIE